MLKQLKKVLAVSLALALLLPASIFTTNVQASGKVVYAETFEAGVGKATQSGGAKLEQVKNKKFDGNDDGAALYVSNRANDWDAADFKFESIGLEDGKTYLVEATIFVDSSVKLPAGAQASLQTVNSYSNWASADYVAGKAVTLSKEFTVDKNKDEALRIQSNADGQAVPFYIGGITFTEVAGAEPAEAGNTLKEVYRETFASGAGAATQSGGAKIEQVTNKTFDGNEDGTALYVSNRANDWDAVDFNFDALGLQDGKKYVVEASVFVDSTVKLPAGAQAVLLTVDSYGNFTGIDYVAGKAVKIEKELTVDKSADKALRIQSNADGKTVPFYIGEVVISEVISAEEADADRPAAKSFTTITFEDDEMGGFVGRSGTETLTITDEANHTENGSKALKVEGRTNTWHGPSLRVEQYVDKGHEYRVAAWVKLIDPTSSQLQLSTQIGDGGSANYVSLSAKTISTADGWVLFEGDYRYNNVSSEYLTIYVESASNSTASFYIDDITFTPTGAGTIDIQKDITPVKEAYKDDFLIGNAISAEDLDGIRLDLLKMHHNAQTTGNAMKPDALQPTKGNFTFDGADKIVNKVIEEGMVMHGHVLVWHQQSPAWMNTKQDADGNTVVLSREEALDNLRTHIRTVMEHFGDRVISWDVVNEGMIDNPPNPSDWEASLRKSHWYEAIGPDYIEQAFRFAREVLDENPEWDIVLYYNDYNDDNQNKATAIYNMVKELNEKYAKENPGKLLIDGVGMQGHYNINTNPENVRLSLERFITLGVEVSITELDIQAGADFELTDKLAIQQAYLYAELFQIFKEHKDHIARVTFWGLDDNTSWRASSNPLIFDKNLQAKPSYYAVIDPAKFLAENQLESAEANQSQAAFGTPVIDGKIDGIWAKTPEMPVNRYQLAWQGASGIAKALWDNENLYVLIQVSDGQLNKTNENAWEQDSVEVFFDQNNGKTTFYQDDDGQYRVNFENTTSFNPGEPDGFKSAVAVNGTNYTVEMKIPFTAITPKVNTEVGFDVQINDAKDGTRQSVATWNDTAGTGYMDTSVFGLLKLVNEAKVTNESTWADYAIESLAVQGAKVSAQSSDALTRAQFIELLVKGFKFNADAAAQTPFTDVKADSPYAASLLIAKELGIVSGDKFKPDQIITREQMSAFIVRALKANGKELTKSSDLSQFNDKNAVSSQLQDDVKKLVGEGLLVGKTNKRLAPKDKLTLGEAAVVLYRVIFQ